jgi:hypothetical protein
MRPARRAWPDRARGAAGCGCRALGDHQSRSARGSNPLAAGGSAPNPPSTNGSSVWGGGRAEWKAGGELQAAERRLEIPSPRSEARRSGVIWRSWREGGDRK